MSAILAAAAFLIVARQQLEGLGGGSVLSLWTRLTVASGLGGLLGWWVAGRIAGPDSPWFDQALALAVGGVLLTVVFVVLSRVLRIEEVSSIQDRVLGKVLRRG